MCRDGTEVPGPFAHPPVNRVTGRNPRDNQFAFHEYSPTVGRAGVLGGMGGRDRHGVRGSCFGRDARGLPIRISQLQRAVVDGVDDRRNRMGVRFALLIRCENSRSVS
jgi:hypothetical protein